MTTAELAAEHERLARYVHGHFRRKLSFEDARDAAADAIAEAHGAQAPIRERERWLRRAAWRNALDQIRRVEGEGAVPRERPADLDDHLDRVTAPELSAPDLLATAAGRAGDAQRLARALRRLRPDEQRALHLRYFDGLAVPEVCEILGCSRHHYENLHKRGLRRLRDALVATTADAACRDARALIVTAIAGPLPADDAVRRDAHLESCLDCRAFSRRRRGLLAVLPLPATGLVDRAMAIFGGAGAAKVAAVASAGAVATGVGVGAELERHDPPPAHHRRAATVAAPARPPVPSLPAASKGSPPAPARAASPRSSAVLRARNRRDTGISAIRTSWRSTPTTPTSPPAPAAAPPALPTGVSQGAAAPRPSTDFSDEFTP